MHNIISHEHNENNSIKKIKQHQCEYMKEESAHMNMHIPMIQFIYGTDGPGFGVTNSHTHTKGSGL